MCGLEVSALGQCGKILNVSFSELRLCLIFTFHEAVEGLTCNEQLLLVLSGQKRKSIDILLIAGFCVLRILCSEK